MQQLFRRIGVVIAALAGQTSGKSFQLASRLVIFPEAVCPWCEETIKCRRIWHIAPGYLKAWWDIVLGPSRGRGRKRGWTLVYKQKIKFANCSYWDEYGGHPHASVDGSICMGNARTEEQALFFGMFPAESHWENRFVTTWLRVVWNHRCKLGPNSSGFQKRQLERQDRLDKEEEE